METKQTNGNGKHEDSGNNVIDLDDELDKFARVDVVDDDRITVAMDFIRIILILNQNYYIIY